MKALSSKGVRQEEPFTPPLVVPTNWWVLLAAIEWIGVAFIPSLTGVQFAPLSVVSFAFVLSNYF